MLFYLRIAHVRGLADEKALEEWIDKLMHLDERHAIARWNQKQEKARKKA